MLSMSYDTALSTSDDVLHVCATCEEFRHQLLAREDVIPLNVLARASDYACTSIAAIEVAS